MPIQRIANGIPSIVRPSYVCFRCQFAAACAAPANRRRFHASPSKPFSRSLKYGASEAIADQDSQNKASVNTADSAPQQSSSNPPEVGVIAGGAEEHDVAESKELGVPEAASRRARDKSKGVEDLIREDQVFQHLERLAKKQARAKRASAKKSAKRVSGKVRYRKIVGEYPRKARSPVRKIMRSAVRRVIASCTDIETITKSEINSIHDAGVSLSDMGGHQTLENALKRKKPTNKLPGSVKTGDISLIPLDIERKPVPRLAYGLSRALFNPGVLELRDSHSRVFNFDPYLEKIVPVAEFDFSTLKQFTTASKDPTLQNVARTFEKKYVGSSSSMTGLLKHFHYLISRWRQPVLEMLSSKFPVQEKPTFTKIQRGPEAAFLRYRDGSYAMDADKEYDDANILSMMGQYMEKLLTVDKEVFERHRVGNSHLLSDEERSTIDSYHYSSVGDFVMRSQLDAYDPRLPGTGMFDLKTRAVLPIRMDTKDFQWGTHYEIQQHQGEYHSFEREYHDMIRATMLKYSLQVRIGRMDGIFIAYHNITRIFGFQYVSLAEIDRALHGQSDPCLGDQEFLISMRILNDLLNKATERFPQQSLRLHVETRPGATSFMYFFAEPVTEEEVNAVQNLNKEKIQRWERRILGLADAEEVPEDAISPIPKTHMDAKPTTGNQSRGDVTVSPSDKDPAVPLGPLLGAIITVESYVNKAPKQRPQNLKADQEWEVKYKIAELENPERVWTLYKACKKRRQDLFQRIAKETAPGSKDFFQDVFMKKIREATDRSRQWRADLDAKEEGKPIRMWNDEATDQAVHQAESTTDSARQPVSQEAIDQAVKQAETTTVVASQPASGSLAARVFNTLKSWTMPGTAMKELKDPPSSNLVNAVAKTAITQDTVLPLAKTRFNSGWVTSDSKIGVAADVTVIVSKAKAAVDFVAPVTNTKPATIPANSIHGRTSTPDAAAVIVKIDEEKKTSEDRSDPDTKTLSKEKTRSPSQTDNRKAAAESVLEKFKPLLESKGIVTTTLTKREHTALHQLLSRLEDKEGGKVGGKSTKSSAKTSKPTRIRSKNSKNSLDGNDAEIHNALGSTFKGSLAQAMGSIVNDEATSTKDAIEVIFGAHKDGSKVDQKKKPSLKNDIIENPEVDEASKAADQPNVEVDAKMTSGAPRPSRSERRKARQERRKALRDRIAAEEKLGREMAVTEPNPESNADLQMFKDLVETDWGTIRAQALSVRKELDTIKTKRHQRLMVAELAASTPPAPPKTLEQGN